MKKKVLLVGVGGIGFRHFQAILKCESDIELYVADIADEALEKVKEYALSLGYNNNILYFKAVNDIKGQYFAAAIIATSSKIRKEVFMSIISNNVLANVVFEKVLFPKVDDYYEVNNVLIEKNISAYVNCTGRENRYYQQLKERMKDCKKIKFYYRGSNWGLACNSIHKIDLFAYLINSEEKELVLNGDLLERKIYDSKRNGYKEFYGRFCGKFNNNAEFLIECDHEDNEVVVDIYADEIFYSIREGNEILVFNENKLESIPFEVEYVSNTTTGIIDNLIRHKEIHLPSYGESMEYHLPFLKMLIKHMNHITGEQNDFCDIT